MKTLEADVMQRSGFENVCAIGSNFQMTDFANHFKKVPLRTNYHHLHSVICKSNGAVFETNFGK